MNFLAHILLAESSPKYMIGSFIADFVKGSRFEGWDQEIVQGMLMHRHVDAFTDAHEVVKQSVRRLRPTQGKFSGIIVDVFYDHFLANHWQHFHPEPLEAFAPRVYQTFTEYRALLPEAVRSFLPFMIEQNWLLNYRTLLGVERSLAGLDKRITAQSSLADAVEALQADYVEFEADFLVFFPELLQFSHAKFEELTEG
jgi:acyl carrier protein phosphodiesterase